MPYLTFGEIVITQLTNFTVKSFNLSGPRSSLIVFRDVKGIISNSGFFSSSFSNQALFSVTPTSNLIMDNFTLNQIDFREIANFITLEETNLDYNGSQLSINSSGNASMEEGLIVYRAISIQNSQFQDIFFRSTLISSSHPYVYFVNNSFTGISLLGNTALGRFRDFFQDDKNFGLWRMRNEVDSFGNRLIGREFSTVGGLLNTSLEYASFSMFYKNKFQSVTIVYDALIIVEKKDLSKSKQSDSSNLVLFKSNILSNFSISSVQEIPLNQFSMVNTALFEDNEFQLLTNTSGIFEISKTHQDSSAPSQFLIQRKFLKCCSCIFEPHRSERYWFYYHNR